MSHRTAEKPGRVFADMLHTSTLTKTCFSDMAANTGESADHVYLEWQSRTLGCWVRCGVEVLEAVNYQAASMTEASELRDVWACGVEWSLHLSDDAKKSLQHEANAAWDARS